MDWREHEEDIVLSPYSPIYILFIIKYLNNYIQYYY